jgi:hypothetical protein
MPSKRGESRGRSPVMTDSSWVLWMHPRFADPKGSVAMANGGSACRGSRLFFIEHAFARTAVLPQMSSGSGVHSLGQRVVC